MENKIKYVQLSSDNKEKCAVFEKMMAAYVKELDEHGHDPMPEGFLQKWIRSIISMQGPSARHLELCYDGETLIGFLYGKIDHEDHKGFIKPGYGYIMEFYVKPEYRRRGYGQAMFRRLEWLFINDGADKMYLTADPVTGRPFWEAMGFLATGERSPENKMEIYEKSASFDWSGNFPVTWSRKNGLYVKPEYRRRGYGQAMFRRLEWLFINDGADKMYLTADPVTGRPFWEAMGFLATGERSPENKMEIYEKSASFDWSGNFPVT